MEGISLYYELTIKNDAARKQIYLLEHTTSPRCCPKTR